MAWPTKQSIGTKHNKSCTRVFANLSPLGCCPRCDELRAGAKPREGWNDAQIKADAVRRQYMAEWFKPGGRHDQIVAAGGVDTNFDY